MVQRDTAAGATSSHSATQPLLRLHSIEGEADPEKTTIYHCKDCQIVHRLTADQNHCRDKEAHAD